MNAKERKKLARAIAHRAEQMKDVIEAKNARIELTGGNPRIAKALSLTDFKASLRLPKQQKEWVAEQHNKVRNPLGQQVNARQKIRGKSIPLI